MKKKAQAIGRPSADTRDLKRSNIVKAARSELLKTAGSSFSLNQVLTAAGGSKTTFYSYFGSREGLLEAVLADVVEDAFKDEGPLDPEASPKSLLTTIAQGTYKAVLSKEAIALYRMAIGEAKDTPALGRGFFTNGPAVARKLLSDLLKNFTVKKKLKVKNPDLAADLFFGMLFGGPLLHRMLMIPTSEDLDVRIDEAVRVFLLGYSP